MLGKSILVAPKVTSTKGALEIVKLQQVTYYLPQNETWYHY